MSRRLPSIQEILNGIRDQISKRRTMISLVVALSILVLIAVFWSYAASASISVPFWSRLGVILILVGIYPATYIAYLEFRPKTQRERLKDDFRLLGLVSEDKLDQTVESLYQTIYHPIQFIAFITLIILFVLLLVGGFLIRDQLGLFVTVQQAEMVFFSFLGAYFFSVQEMVRRYNTFDLLPQVYSSILVRMVSAVLLTYVGASVILDDSNVTTWGPVLAFVIGAFPQYGLQWFTDSISKLFPGFRTDPVSRRPLSKIVGISPWHEARLEEMGLDDAQNLATVDIRRLLLTTQFDTQEIINWIDQAILYIKVGDMLDRFRNTQITTFFELRTVINNQALSISSAITSEDTENKERRRDAWRPLLTILGFTDEIELRRLLDYSNYPNFAHVVQYYSNTETVVRQRALIGRDILIGDDAVTLAGSIMIEGASQRTAAERANYEDDIEKGQMLVAQYKDDPELHLRLAVTYYSAGKYDEARASYEKTLQLEPRKVGAYYGLSAISLDMGNKEVEGSVAAKTSYQESVKYCTAAISISPIFAKAYNTRGLAYMKLGYLDQALKDLHQAVELDQKLDVAYLNRGVVYLAHTAFADEARAAFDKADRDIQIAYVLGHRSQTLWVSWGTALIGLEQYEEAIQKLSHAVLDEDDLALVYSRRGYAYLQLGQRYYDQARSDLQTAIEKNPTLTDAYGNLGLLEAKAGNDEKAVEYYEKALELNSDLYTIRYNLGEALYRLKKFKKAEEHFQNVVRTAPDESEDLQRAMESLSQLWKAR